LEQIRKTFRMAGRLAIEILSVDHLEVIDLAAQTRLTTYDASYLWLARKTGGELVTLDKRLLKASGGAALAMIGGGN
jgi:predicted nucleic acid-binding protein